jgi:hypothetical protein
VYNDTVFLFTKNWQDQTTGMYCFPARPGNCRISARAYFDVDGLVTGADISENGDFLVLLGYKDYIPFVWVFYDYRYPDFFHGKQARIDFPDYLDLQAEGIAVKSAARVYISCEAGISCWLFGHEAAGQRQLAGMILEELSSGGSNGS